MTQSRFNAPAKFWYARLFHDRYRMTRDGGHVTISAIPSGIQYVGTMSLMYQDFYYQRNNPYSTYNRIPPVDVGLEFDDYPEAVDDDEDFCLVNAGDDGDDVMHGRGAP